MAPSLLKQVCFGLRSDPATGPEHPASLFLPSGGSLARPPASPFLPLSFLTRPPALDPGFSSICLPVSFGIPDAWLRHDALQISGTQGHRLTFTQPALFGASGSWACSVPQFLCVSRILSLLCFCLVVLSAAPWEWGCPGRFSR